MGWGYTGVFATKNGGGKHGQKKVPAEIGMHAGVHAGEDAGRCRQCRTDHPGPAHHTLGIEACHGGKFRFVRDGPHGASQLRTGEKHVSNLPRRPG